jgi:hypothetical protein
MDEDLLERIDAEDEVIRNGRSAFLRAAASFYLAAKNRRETDRRIADAYADHADQMIDEVAEFMDLQEWPAS